MSGLWGRCLKTKAQCRHWVGPSVVARSADIICLHYSQCRHRVGPSEMLQVALVDMEPALSSERQHAISWSRVCVRVSRVKLFQLLRCIENVRREEFLENITKLLILTFPIKAERLFYSVCSAIFPMLYSTPCENQNCYEGHGTVAFKTINITCI